MPTLQQKRGTSAALAAVNPTPLAGEIVWVSDTNTLRVGDGTTAYSSLAVISATPTSHSHGNITNAGAIGSTANLPIITTTSGVLTTGSFGTTAATFCEGNDSRLSDTRTPTDGSVTTAKIANDAVTYAKIQNVSDTDRLLGRSSAGAGDVEEISCGSFGRSLIGSADAAAARTVLSVQPTASPAFTGAATFAVASGSSVPVTITNEGTGNSFVVNDAPATDSTPFVIDASGNVGVGTSSPATKVAVYDASSSLVSVDGDSTTQFRATRYSSDGFVSAVSVRKARGTFASPSAVTATDTAGAVFFAAYGGTNFRNIGRVDALVETYTSDTSISGALRFYTNNASTDVTERLRITSTGVINIQSGGSASAPILTSTVGGSDTGVWFPAADEIAIATSGANRIFVDASGNVRINNADAATSAAGCIHIKNGTAPTANITDGVVLFAADISSSSELRVRDEAGNTTTLSPHAFPLIPDGPSEPMAWSYYSERDGRRINVDMLRVVRLLEQLTGEKLVYEE